MWRHFGFFDTNTCPLKIFGDPVEQRWRLVPQSGQMESVSIERYDKQKPLSIDKPNDEPVYSPVCCKCDHLLSVRDRRCLAFPNGIPYVIWSGDDPHTSHFAGDNGILFRYAKTS